ncbi:unnamed protein product [Protopolystoma xenopodis]|uniref:Uncharacterized protein n=1 Tax=Protopolystoma xenopodis TaxID=117903 RepID=A0A3S4ZW50_9PLAT|nr:unnamed protein product [Protopolystoma xenopodis]
MPSSAPMCPRAASCPSFTLLDQNRKLLDPASLPTAKRTTSPLILPSTASFAHKSASLSSSRLNSSNHSFYMPIDTDPLKQLGFLLSITLRALDNVFHLTSELAESKQQIELMQARCAQLDGLLAHAQFGGGESSQC